MAEGFICSRFRRPPSPVRQDSRPQLAKEEQPPPALVTTESAEQSTEKRTLNIGLLSEAISSLILLPVSHLSVTLRASYGSCFRPDGFERRTGAVVVAALFYIYFLYRINMWKEIDNLKEAYGDKKAATASSLRIISTFCTDGPISVSYHAQISSSSPSHDSLYVMSYSSSLGRASCVFPDSRSPIDR